jgi:hypothetical protein
MEKRKGNIEKEQEQKQSDKNTRNSYLIDLIVPL